MTRLRHKTRRSGVVRVRDAAYDLDQDGYVDVSTEHAALLLQGPFSEAPKQRTIVPPQRPAAEQQTIVPPQRPAAEPVTEGDELDALDRDELIKRSEELGLFVDRRTSKVKLLAAIRAANRS